MKVKQVLITALVLGLLVVYTATTYAQTPPSIPIGPGLTEDKPQSKLWYTDNANGTVTWWGILGFVGDANAVEGVYFYKLENGVLVRQTFLDALVDANLEARADVLWNGTHLFVLMYRGSSASLSKYTYNASTQTYTRLAGFPAPITGFRPNSESATIAQDSTGKLWIAYDPRLTINPPPSPHPCPFQENLTRFNEIHVLWSADHITWDASNTSTTRVVLQSPLCDDDLAGIVAFNGRIGVLWSDQRGDLDTPAERDNFSFRFHVDGAPETSWSLVEVVPVPTSRLIADDHIHLTVTDQGDVLVATKSSTVATDANGDPILDEDGDPIDLNEINLFVRRYNGNPANPWDGPYFVTSNASRPIVVFDKASKDVYVFYTGAFNFPVPEHRNISYKVAKLSELADLDLSPEYVFIEVPLPVGGCDPNEDVPESPAFCPQYGVNNATTTKQAVDVSKGLLVVAKDEREDEADLPDDLGDAPELSRAYYNLLTAARPRIAASADDADQKSGSGTADISDPDFDLGLKPVGLRFQLLVPQGAKILRAYVQFTAEDPHTEPTTLTIEGEASDHAQPFKRVKNNITDRLRTFNEVSWAVSSWPTDKEAGPGQRTPDLSAVIQEVVDRPGWASGNGLVLIVTGSGYREAYTYDGDRKKAPLLHVEYVQ